MGFCGSAIRGAVFVWGGRSASGPLAVPPPARRHVIARPASEPLAVQPSSRRRYVAYIVPAGFDGSGFQQTLSSSGSAELPGMCSNGTNAAGCAERLRTVAP
jgi:hypothetical protein